MSKEDLGDDDPDGTEREFRNQALNAGGSLVQAGIVYGGVNIYGTDIAIEQLRHELAQCRAGYGELEERYQAVMLERDEHREKLRELQSQLDDKAAQIDSLRDLLEAAERRAARATAEADQHAAAAEDAVLGLALYRDLGEYRHTRVMTRDSAPSESMVCVTALLAVIALTVAMLPLADSHIRWMALFVVVTYLPLAVFGAWQRRKLGTPETGVHIFARGVVIDRSGRLSSYSRDQLAARSYVYNQVLSSRAPGSVHPVPHLDLEDLDGRAVVMIPNPSDDLVTLVKGASARFIEEAPGLYREHALQSRSSGR